MRQRQITWMLLALLKSPWSRACFSCNNFCTTPSDTSLHPTPQSDATHAHHQRAAQTETCTILTAGSTCHGVIARLFCEVHFQPACGVAAFKTHFEIGALALRLASRRAAPSSCCCHPSRASCWAPAAEEQQRMSDGVCANCPVVASLGEKPADNPCLNTRMCHRYSLELMADIAFTYIVMHARHHQPDLHPLG